MSGVRLTERQSDNLRAMAAGYEITPLTNGTTGEMQQLAQLGLAKNVSQEPNGETYEITPAGRAWLERNKA